MTFFMHKGVTLLEDGPGGTMSDEPEPRNRARSCQRKSNSIPAARGKLTVSKASLVTWIFFYLYIT